MLPTLIGLTLSFIGAFAIILETISGRSIRPKIYFNVLQGVHEYNINDKPVKIKLYANEKRVLLWIIFIVIGFFVQIAGFI